MKKKPSKGVKEILKEESIKNVVNLLGMAIFAIIGFVISDVTFEWRQNRQKGNIQFVYDNKDDSILSAYIISANNINYYYKTIKDLPIKLVPDYYTYKIYTGSLLIYEGSFQIGAKDKKTINIPYQKNNFFFINMQIDKQIYGPNDNMLLTVTSSEHCWVYFLSYIEDEIKYLNQTAIELFPFTSKMLSEITARKTPGKDNIIAIALRENNKSILNEAITALFKDSKSDYQKVSQRWRSSWVSFSVE